MFSFDTLSTSVSLDGCGRPREVWVGGQRHRVTAIESMRDETAAYPAGAGPRTLFVVRASGRRYRLVHLLHQREWTVEQVGAVDPRLTVAA